MRESVKRDCVSHRTVPTTREGSAVRQRNMSALQKDGQNWWKIQPKYSNEVLIGNWLEERRRFTKDPGKLGSSIYKTDFIWFPDHKPDQTLRRTMMEKFEGLPVQHFFTHHDEPRSRNLVSEYDDKYNRHGYNPVLLPLHSRNKRKFAWIPKKADHPILEPPTNYGLLEHLMKKWHKKEAGVMTSVYTTSYESPPISAFATHQLGQAATTHVLPSNQGHLPQNVSRILDYEGCQKYLQVIRQLVRDRKARDASL
ncbi:cilia- and flagella-associated protein 107 [Strix aluco]|uniref:cilia- and flagella-associated protein 107 n=1 Tax=Strix aluco TaxID=111821 RepID=UPI003DA25172